MSAEFVPLARLLRVGDDDVSPDPLAIDDGPCESARTDTPFPPSDVACDVPAEPAPAYGDAGADLHGEACATVRALRVARARMLDAFEDAAVRMVRELAADVVARELRLAPCDIGAAIARVVERAPAVRARVAPGETHRVAGVPVVADATLAPGDAIVELAGGELDLRLGVRLAAVLEAFA